MPKGLFSCIALAAIFIYLETKSVTSANLGYRDWTLKAQCQATCLAKYGQKEVIHSYLDEFYKPYSCNGMCKDCTKGCVSSQKDCNCQRNQTCLESCELMRRLMNITMPTESDVLRHVNCTVDTPEVLCVNRAMNRADISIRLHAQCSRDIPVVFLPAFRVNHRRTGDWFYLGTRFQPIVTFKSRYGMSMQFGVTVISQDGVVAESNASEWTILTRIDSLPPPSNVHVLSQLVTSLRVETVIGWEVPPDGPCSFQVSVMDTDRVSHYEEFLPRLLIPGLELDRTYDVKIMATNKALKRNSNTTSFRFTTPTCLQTTGHNYTSCAPDPPRNFTVTDKWTNGENFSVNITWREPEFFSEENTISHYILGWLKLGETPSDNGHGTISMDKYQTWFVMSGLKATGGEYELDLAAVSNSGKMSSKEYLYVPADRIPENTLSTQQSDSKGSSQLTVPNSVRTVDALPFILTPILAVVFATLLFVLVRVARSSKLKWLPRRTPNSPRFPFVENAIYETDNFYTSASSRTAETTFVEPSEWVKDNSEIVFDWLKMDGVIGEGAFGKVVKADLKLPKALQTAYRSLTKNTTVAVKMLKDLSTAEDQQNMLREINLMKQLGRHPFIVSMLGCCTKPPNICIIMDYCPLGDLRSYLQELRRKRKKMTRHHVRRLYPGEEENVESGKRLLSDEVSDSLANYAGSEYLEDKHIAKIFDVNVKNFPECVETKDISKHCELSDNEAKSNSRLLSYARQIAFGMEYLAQKKFVHRDLAARNVLVAGENLVKISDFGLTRDIYEGSIYLKKTTGRLPVKWMSIEAIFRQEYTIKSDVWSFGVVLWEIVTLGGVPYPGVSSRELFNLLKDGYRMVKPDNCSREMYDIMISCWQPEPEDRPDFTQLKESLERILENSNAYIDFSVDCNQQYYEKEKDTWIKRVVMSTIDAEALSSREGIEDGIHLRSVVQELFELSKGLIVVEAVNSTKLVDKRFRLNIAAIKQSLDTREISSVKLCPESKLLPNCMSKRRASDVNLLELLQSVVSANSDIRNNSSDRLSTSSAESTVFLDKALRLDSGPDT